MKKQEFISKIHPFPYEGFKADDIMIRFSNIEDYRTTLFNLHSITFEIQDDGSGAGWGSDRTFTIDLSNTIFYTNGLMRISRERFIDSMGFKPRDLNSVITKIQMNYFIRNNKLKNFDCEGGYISSKNFRYETNCHLNEINKVVFKKVNAQLIELFLTEYKVEKPKFKDFVEDLQEIVFPNFIFGY